MSKNVLAYLGDYKPFVDKTKQIIPILLKRRRDLESEKTTTKEENEGKY